MKQFCAANDGTQPLGGFNVVITSGKVEQPTRLPESLDGARLVSEEAKMFAELMLERRQ